MILTLTRTVATLLLGFLGFGLPLALAQDAPWNSLRERKVAVNPAGQLLDSLTVVPGSLSIRHTSGSPISPDQYQLHGRYLSWIQMPGDSVWLRYRVLPFDLLATSQLLDSSILVRDEAGLLIGGYDPYQRSDIFDSDGRVNYRGSFSRGISIGNRQDLVLNSAFNLQLEGELGNGIQVLAAITDESLPIQPEGNTQQLREFDRIFIQLSRDRTSLTAGDYELRQPQGYFMRYFKKLEGATLRTTTGAETNQDGGVLETRASIAVARGQFVRQTIDPIEGNQGPYRLRGNGEQRFLVVLAGTERIYLNGELLERGQDADYVIDYNLAELTFTTRRLITRDSRIVAEYEFSDQRYLRTLYALDNRYEQGNWTVYANLLSQQDSKTATGDLLLTDEQRRRLAEAGDSPSDSLVSSIELLEGRSDQRATYVLVDTLIPCSGERTVFLRYTTETAGELYVARFSDLGPGGGDYEIDPTTLANERVYRYVAPDPVTCASQGRFAPLSQLVAPELQRLLTVGTALKTEGGALRVEAAQSSQDLNRFSSLDSDDDQGLALRLDAHQEFLLGADSTAWSLTPRFSLEWVEANYRSINPYRSPDFLRNWNLSDRLGASDLDQRTEQLVIAGLGLQHREWGNLDYEYSRFDRRAVYLGQRHAVQGQLERSGWRLAGGASLLENRTSAGPTQAGSTTENGRFWRPQLQLSKNWSRYQLGASFQAETSERFIGQTDSLAPTSFAFKQYSLELASLPTEGRFDFSLEARQRTDWQGLGGLLSEVTRANELELNGNLTSSEQLQLGGNFSYRRLRVKERDLVGQTPGQTFLGRIDIRARLFGNSLRSQTAYTLGSGQEPRVDFQYLYVGPGLGQYIWLDSLYNNDGRIQQNEMEIAPFTDQADYVRVSIFTDEFIRTDNAGLNQSLQWDGSRLWSDPKGWQKLVKRLQLQASITIDRKTRQADGIQSWNPLQLNISDTALVSLSSGSRQALFFNRNHAKYDFQISQNDLRRRQVLTTGFESSRRQEWEARLRYRPVTALSLEAVGRSGQRSADSEFFNNKDYEINFYSLGPEVDWQPGQDFRFKSSLQLGEEQNQLLTGNNEKSQRTEWELTGNFRRWLDLRLRYVKIDLEGDARSPVGFALLNGLQVGQNWLWTVNATRQLGQYLQLTLSYEGRQTGMAPTVHIGRAQVTAIF